MNISELTQNAWVVFDDYTPDGKAETIKAKVIQIGENNTVKCQRGDEIYNRSCSILFPIVVTDDDLISNGFKFRQVTPQLKDFSLEKRTKIEDCEAEEVATVSIRIHDNDTEAYDICIEKHLEWQPGQRKNILHFERWGLLWTHKLQSYLCEAGFCELAENYKLED